MAGLGSSAALSKEPSSKLGGSSKALSARATQMSAQKVVDFDPKSVGSFLRRAHPTKTAEHVAAAIDAPVETVRQWLRGASNPGWFATLALISVYGPELLAAVRPSLSPWVKRALIRERRLLATNELDRLLERIEGLRDEDSLEGAAPRGLVGRLGNLLRADLDDGSDVRRDDVGGKQDPCGSDLGDETLRATGEG